MISLSKPCHKETSGLKDFNGELWKTLNEEVILILHKQTQKIKEGTFPNLYVARVTLILNLKMILQEKKTSIDKYSIWT